ncbi:hypothetical protein C8R42DRAFT_677853 [Lentinula raphanica]|nr:hypothetical protein C8R42DRAFT_677853 [Lentinula raphanica]
MSSLVVTRLEQDGPLSAVGKQCSHPTCHLVDFLPFQYHYKVAEHSFCPKYDESKHNRITLCPAAIRPGQDLNVRIEDHFAKESKKSTLVLFAPTCCDVCDYTSIPSRSVHRTPGDHACSSTQSARSNVQATSRSSVSNSASHAASSLLPSASSSLPFDHKSIAMTSTTLNDRPLKSKRNNASH